MKKLSVMLVALFFLIPTLASAQLFVGFGGGMKFEKDPEHPEKGIPIKGNIFSNLRIGISQDNQFFNGDQLTVEANIKPTLSTHSFTNLGGNVAYGYYIQRNWVVAGMFGYYYAMVSSDKKSENYSTFSYGGRVTYKNLLYLQAQGGSKQQKPFQLEAGIMYRFGD